MLSTDAELSGDVMFILGGFGHECMVPVGASFRNRGVRIDVHDAVGAQLLIPIGRMRPGDARPAAAGASQPATAAADEAESDATAPNWSMDTSLNEAVAELHEKLREVEEADDISPEVQQELGRILFKKKTVTEGGFKRQYAASRAETVSSASSAAVRRQQAEQRRCCGRLRSTTCGWPD